MVRVDHKNPARLVSEIEFEYGLENGTLASKQVTRYISKARREAILHLREMGLSFPDIGRMLSRDHTSIIRMMNSKVQKPGEKAGKTPGTTRGKARGRAGEKSRK